MVTRTPKSAIGITAVGTLIEVIDQSHCDAGVHRRGEAEAPAHRLDHVGENQQFLEQRIDDRDREGDEHLGVRNPGHPPDHPFEQAVSH
jgi:hypothetical protein